MPFHESIVKLDQVYFLDDFWGSAYDNLAWALTVGGASTFANTTGLGGQATMTVAASGGTCLLAQNTGLNFSITKNLELRWRIKIPTSTSFGFRVGARTDATHYVAWVADSAVSANWICESNNGGSITSDTSTTAVDANWHEVYISCSSGSALFLLDGVLIDTITLNLPPGDLQPFTYGITLAASVRTVLFDYVEAYGDRE